MQIFVNYYLLKKLHPLLRFQNESIGILTTTVRIIDQILELTNGKLCNVENVCTLLYYFQSATTFKWAGNFFIWNGAP